MPDEFKLKTKPSRDETDQTNWDETSKELTIKVIKKGESFIYLRDDNFYICC